jgi:hypothetical protein
MFVVEIEQNVRAKIQNLIRRSDYLGRSEGGNARDANHLSECRAWIVEALNVIELAVPVPKNAYRRHIEKIGENVGNYAERVASMAQMLRALLRDIDAGLVIDLANKVRAETFDNFLDHAEEYLQKNRKNEAGVIAGVVFEDAIRRIYRDKIGDDNGQALLKEIVLTKASIGRAYRYGTMSSSIFGRGRLSATENTS